MNYMVSNTLMIILGVSQSLMFSFNHLVERKIQEKGLTAYSTFSVQKYVLYPSLLLMILFWDTELILKLLSDVKLLSLIFIFTILNMASKLSKVFLVNGTSYLTLMTILKQIIGIISLLLFGLLINKDVPNIYAYIGLGIMLISYTIKPSNSKKNKRDLFKYSIYFVVFCTILSGILDSLNSSLFKEILRDSSSLIFILSITLVFRALLIYIMNFIFKLPSKQTKIMKKERKTLFLIATLLFLAHIPQAFAIKNMPIYVFGILSSVGFFMKMFSDVKNKRIEFDRKAITFCIISIIGILVTSYSLYV